ncbi:MAG: zinc metallopeptidase [Verrucomicrobiota bacterium]
MIWIIFGFTLVISLITAGMVKSAFFKYKQIPVRSGLTGAQAANRILDAAGIHDVEIEAANGFLGDHYDPIHKKLVLSEEIYHGQSVAALSIAAHECGHAIQHKIAYAPLQWRMASVGITNYANQVVTWLPIIGMFTGLIATYTGFLIMGIGWGVIMAFNLVTLPVEFDASRRAKLILPKMNMITEGEEMRGVHKMLNAAAWTYVAAFITSLLYTLYYLLPFILGRRDD